jgi:hypothetical protein
VFTEVEVPKFTGDLALGGLSLGLAGAATAGRSPAMADVLPYIPLATRDFGRGAAVVAQLPLRWAAKGSGLVAVTATLVPANGGAPVQLEKASLPAPQYEQVAGQVYRVAIPQNLAPGAYRLAVEAVMGQKRAAREVNFRIVE